MHGIFVGMNYMLFHALDSHFIRHPYLRVIFMKFPANFVFLRLQVYEVIQINSIQKNVHWKLLCKHRFAEDLNEIMECRTKSFLSNKIFFYRLCLRFGCLVLWTLYKQQNVRNVLHIWNGISLWVKKETKFRVGILRVTGMKIYK